MRITNCFGTRFIGKMGDSCVAYVSRGRNYLRAYSAPRGPPSDLQEEQRARFAEASAAWQRLLEDERRAYDREARRMSGYNLFIRRYLAGHLHTPPPFRPRASVPSSMVRFEVPTDPAPSRAGDR